MGFVGGKYGILAGELVEPGSRMHRHQGFGFEGRL